MELDNNANSVLLLHYHLVLVVKYRRQVFDDRISGRAREIFEKLWKEYFWSQSFCLLTTGGAPVEAVKRR